jgi:nucleoside 2-deoxyribosyltransferase
MTAETTQNKSVTLTEVFVGGPFFNLVDPQTGAMSEADQAKFSVLIEYFENLGAKVHNAHRREAWGKEFLTADEATLRDYTEIKASDIFVAYPGVPASPGTHVEIGWASAMGKPIILFLEKGEKHTFLITGLGTIADIEFIEFTDTADVMAQLEVAVAKVMSRATDKGAADGAK